MTDSKMQDLLNFLFIRTDNRKDVVEVMELLNSPSQKLVHALGHHHFTSEEVFLSGGCCNDDVMQQP